MAELVSICSFGSYFSLMVSLLFSRFDSVGTTTLNRNDYS